MTVFVACGIEIGFAVGRGYVRLVFELLVDVVAVVAGMPCFGWRGDSKLQPVVAALAGGIVCFSGITEG